MKVREIMTRGVGVCGPHTNAAAIAEILWSRDCGAVPVVDERGILQGIVTDRDLSIALGTRNLRASTVRADDVMTRDVATCGPEDDVLHALELMHRFRVRRLPVADQDARVEGIVSISDIVRAAAHPGDGLSMAMVMKAMARINDRSAPRDEPLLAAAATS